MEITSPRNCCGGCNSFWETILALMPLSFASYFSKGSLPTFAWCSSPEGTTLDQLAEMADKVMEVASPSLATLSKPPASGPAPPPALADELRQLRSDVSRLEKLVTRLACNRSSSRLNRHSSRHSPTPPPTEDSSDSLCWYYHKFGQAQKCHSPCTWSRPVTSGDRCCQPNPPRSPILCAL